MALALRPALPGQRHPVFGVGATGGAANVGHPGDRLHACCAPAHRRRRQGIQGVIANGVRAVRVVGRDDALADLRASTPPGSRRWPCCRAIPCRRVVSALADGEKTWPAAPTSWPRPGSNGTRWTWCSWTTWVQRLEAIGASLFRIGLEHRPPAWRWWCWPRYSTRCACKPCPQREEIAVARLMSATESVASRGGLPVPGRYAGALASLGHRRGGGRAVAVEQRPALAWPAATARNSPRCPAWCCWRP